MQGCIRWGNYQTVRGVVQVMANFNFNTVIIGGRLCAAPEIKTTINGTVVTSFDVAVSRQDNTDFFRVVAWKNTAEFVCKYFGKGSSICVKGELQTRKYEAKNGEKRTATEIVARDVYFVDSKGERAADKPANDTPEPPAQFEPISTDEELPF